MKSQLLLFLFIQLIKQQNICSEDQLVQEIREDLEDNGKLDCLITSLPPSDVVETPQKRELRIKAEWNSDCAFQSKQNNWLVPLLKNYSLPKGLVDVNGVPVQDSLPNQADMCQIIRAFVANGLFSQVTDNVNNIPVEITDYIDCPGVQGRFLKLGQTEICAATSGSYLQADKWVIFLEGTSIQFNGLPKWKLTDKSTQIFAEEGALDENVQ